MSKRYNTPEKLERARIYRAEWRKRNPERDKETGLRWRRRNGYLPRPPKMSNEERLRRKREHAMKLARAAGVKPMKVYPPEERVIRKREYFRAWRIKNPHLWKEAKRRFAERHPGYQKKINQTPGAVQSRKNYNKRNPHMLRIGWQRRRSREISQLHPECDKLLDAAISREALRLTKETGIPHHVDHIIPIKHGGWHHHLNLQVLPKKINAEKLADPFWEQAPYKCWRDVPEYLWPESLADEYNALKYGIAI